MASVVASRRLVSEADMFFAVTLLAFCGCTMFFDLGGNLGAKALMLADTIVYGGASVANGIAEGWASRAACKGTDYSIETYRAHQFIGASLCRFVAPVVTRFILDIGGLHTWRHLRRSKTELDDVAMADFARSDHGRCSGVLRTAKSDAIRSSKLVADGRPFVRFKFKLVRASPRSLTKVLGALVRYQLKHSSTLSQVLQGRPWREILPRCLCQVTVAFMVGLAVFCLLAAVAFAPTRSLALGPAGAVAAPPAPVAAAAAAVTLRPLWQFPMLSLQELRQVENVVFEENQLRHSLRVAVTSKMFDGSVLLQSTDSSLRVEKSGRGVWLRDGQEVPLDDMEALRQLPGADEGLAWMGAQLTTEVVAPA
ncbi:hypothetical protein AK812_SmicGene28896 [Symbiodinium microadriaticum]|uniref:Uncharacterized protein n=1 Tax=Symbiodinium microadriaticum TaxID=2951 RepID=A0A1Q9D393_SYMMI|nr:hypothetical protein AK812_SmicGene28896 [Symbiodinium microadriaticum]